MIVHVVQKCGHNLLQDPSVCMSVRPSNAQPVIIDAATTKWYFISSTFSQITLVDCSCYIYSLVDIWWWQLIFCVFLCVCVCVTDEWNSSEKVKLSAEMSINAFQTLKVWFVICVTISYWLVKLAMKSQLHRHTRFDMWGGGGWAPTRGPLLIHFLTSIDWNGAFWSTLTYALFMASNDPTRSVWLKISGTRGRPPPIIYAPIVRPMNALQLCMWQFSHRCYGWGTMSENRSKIGDFAPTRSLWSKFLAPHL